MTTLTESRISAILQSQHGIGCIVADGMAKSIVREIAVSKPNPKPMPSNAMVVRLMRAYWDASDVGEPGDFDAYVEACGWYDRAVLECRACVEAQLSALSDAGLAVLPLEATNVMANRRWRKDEWRRMAAAFHPDQLGDKP